MDRNITVGYAVAVLPQAIAYFEKLGIDFCCGGNRPVTSAAAAKGLSAEEIFAQLDKFEKELEASGKANDFIKMSSLELSDYIVKVHHTFLRKNLPTAHQYMSAVLRAHGERHQELFTVAKLFGLLKSDLEQHIIKEEMFLFPAIVNAEKEKSLALIPEYIDEHETAGDILEKLNSATEHYTLPSDACETYAALFGLFKDIERDLHRHIHLENNILFKRVNDN